jgi:hypothetical protein
MEGFHDEATVRLPYGGRRPPPIRRTACNRSQMGRRAFRSAQEGANQGEEGDPWLNGLCSSSSALVRAAPSPLCIRDISNNSKRRISQI